MSYRSVLIPLILASLPRLAPAAPKWHRLEAGRWELFTDAGEKTGAQVLAQLLDLQGILAAQAQAIAGTAPQASPPVRVILFKSPKDFKPFQRSATSRGSFQPSGERDYIILTQLSDDTLRAAAHELTHLILHHAAGPMPGWLEEGLAEYYSTARRTGNQAVFGKPVADHVRLLANEPSGSGPWANPQQFLTLRSDDVFRSDPRAVGLYYAQSWAVVHLLMSTPQPQQRLNDFLARLRNGLDQASAFEQAFGQTPAAAIAAASQRVAVNRFLESSAPLPATASVAPGAAREITEPEAAGARADALLASGRLTEASESLLDAARRWPSDPAPVAGLGYLAMRRGDYETARRQLELAIARGDRQASTRFEYAMLIRDTKGPEALVVQSLRETVDLSPTFAEAWYALGATLLRQGNAAEAVDCLRRATAILPRQSVFWESYGRALLAAGDRPAAREAALSATRASLTPEQAQMAQGLLRDIDTQPPGRTPAKPAVSTPQGWQPRQGDSTVSGRLVFVDCETSLLKFHIETKPAAGRTPAQKTILASDKPNLIMLRGGGPERKEFVCAAQASRPLVEAGYIAKPAEPAPPPPPPPPPPSKPATKSSKSAKAKAAPPPKRAPAPKPAKPADPPIAGELVWLEFK